MEFTKDGIIFYLFSCSLVLSFDDVKINNFKNILERARYKIKKTKIIKDFLVKIGKKKFWERFWPLF